MKPQCCIISLLFFLISMSLFPYTISVTISTDCSYNTYHDEEGANLVDYPDWNDYKDNPTLHPAYDHTDNNPQTCSSTQTVEIPDGVQPEDVQTYLDEIKDGSAPDGDVTAAGDVPETLNQNETASGDTPVLDALITGTEAEIADRVSENKASENIACSPCAGDPVRLATGDYTTGVTDISYSYINDSIKFSRVYLSSNHSAHALGRGWSFNYDTRIIRGIKPNAALITRQAEGEAEEARVLYGQSIAAFKTALVALNGIIGNSDDASYQQYLAGYNITMAAVYNTIGLSQVNVKGKVITWAENLEKTISSLNQVLNSTGYPEVRARINNDIANAANALYNHVIPFRNRAKEAKKNLIISFKRIVNTAGIVEQFEKKAKLMQQEEALAGANQLHNQYVFNAGDPAGWQLTGNDTVTLVDEAGTPHLYAITTAPDYNSAACYPAGAQTMPVQPNDDTLEIQADHSYLLKRKSGELRYFSVYGKLLAIVDINGNSLNFIYDASNRLAVVTDSYGRMSQVAWKQNRIIAITDPAGRSFSYEYNADGQLAAVADPAGHVTRFAYAGGLLVEKTAPDNNSEKYTYSDLNGRQVITQTENTAGFHESFRYYPAEHYTEFENASGIMERHFYNDKNLDTRIEYSDDSFAQMSYDDNNNLVTKTDQLGRVFRYSYDADRNLVKTVYPDGTEETWLYNALNRITSHTEKGGNTFTYSYDKNGNLIHVNYPDQTTVSMQYDSRGRLAAGTDQIGNKTTYSYDVFGYPAAITAPDGSVESFKYTLAGQLLTYIDQLGNITTYEYDQANNLVRQIDNLGYSETYVYDTRNNLIAKTDKNGNSTAYQYDTRNNLVKITRPNKETLEYRYREDGKLIEKIGNGINHITYRYDIRGNPAAATQEELAITTALEYDAAGNTTARIDGEGNRTEYSYDEFNRVIREKHPDNSIKQTAYDGNGNILAITGETGNTTWFEYDTMNRLVKTTDAANNTRLIFYDKIGKVSSLIDPAGNTTGYRYNSVGKLVEEINPLQDSVQYEYDAKGNLVKSTDPEGNATVYHYDRAGRLITEVNPLDSSKEYSYDPAGNLAAIKDGNGYITTYQYDNINRVKAVIDPYNNQTSYVYNYLGLIEKTVDPLNNTTTREYDALGRLVKTTNPLGASQTYRYDKNDNLVEAIDALGRVTRHTYDSRNRKTADINALQEITGYEYDAVNNLTGFIDAKNHEYGYQFDALNRITREINQQGAVRTYTYDSKGNLAAKTDFNGSTAAFSYDPLNRLNEVLFADGTRKQFAYDANSNILRAENNAQAIEFEYDALNRLVKQTDQALDQVVEYSYDNNDNRIATRWLNDTRKIQYVYGKVNELLKVIDPDKDITAYEYDALAREIVRAAPNGIITETAYDRAGWITLIKNYADRQHGADKLLKSYAYLYNAAGERISQLDEEGDITAYQYDELGRIRNVYYPFEENKKNEDFMERFALGLYPVPETGKQGKAGYPFLLPGNPGYGYTGAEDSIKQALSENTSLYKAYSGKTAAGFINKLVLDDNTESSLKSLYRMLNPRARYFDPSRQYVWTESFTYDENSNRTSKVNGWGVIDYGYDAGNQLLTAGNMHYNYDGNGNLVKEESGELATVYSYNAENRLMDVYRENSGFQTGKSRAQGSGVTYQYDALGRRTARAEYYKSNAYYNRKEQVTEWPGTNTSYLYDGLSMNVLGEFTDYAFNGFPGKGYGYTGWLRPSYAKYNPVSESVYGNGRLVSRTGFNPGSQWPGNPFYRNDKSYYSQDASGSVIMLTGMHGEQKTQYTYDAFGNAYAGSLGQGNSYGFNGKLYDPLAGLYNYGFRDYSAQLGRWTTVDPVRAGLNWYAYCGNDPVNYIDLFGFEEVCLQMLSETVSNYTVGTYWSVDDQGFKKKGFVATLEPVLTNAKIDIGMGTTFLGRLLSIDYTVFNDIELGDLFADSIVHRPLSDPGYLAYNLQLSGDIRPAKTEAHHIVAGDDRRAEIAREILMEYNIDINNPANGVFLPATKDSKAPGAYHPGLHTKTYYENVNDIISEAANLGEEAVQLALQSIKLQLLTDTFPH